MGNIVLAAKMFYEMLHSHFVPTLNRSLKMEIFFFMLFVLSIVNIAVIFKDDD